MSWIEDVGGFPAVASSIKAQQQAEDQAAAAAAAQQAQAAAQQTVNSKDKTINELRDELDTARLFLLSGGENGGDEFVLGNMLAHNNDPKAATGGEKKPQTDSLFNIFDDSNPSKGESKQSGLNSLLKLALFKKAINLFNQKGESNQSGLNSLLKLALLEKIVNPLKQDGNYSKQNRNPEAAINVFNMGAAEESI